MAPMAAAQAELPKQTWKRQLLDLLVLVEQELLQRLLLALVLSGLQILQGLQLGDVA